MYANYVGIRKGNCAALLAPSPAGSFSVYSTPTFLIGGNFSVRVTRDAREYFVWKKETLEATEARLKELTIFSDELSQLILPRL